MRLCTQTAFRVSAVIIIIQTIFMISISYRRWGNEVTLQKQSPLDDNIQAARGGENQGLLTVKPRSGMNPTHRKQNTRVDQKQIKIIKQLTEDNEKLVKSVERRCKAEKKAITSNYMDYEKYSALQDWVWMVFPPHELYYCAVPKCGSTTWKSYLMEDVGLDWIGLDTHVAARLFGARGHINKAGNTPIEWLSTQNYTHRMMIVRNPWGRVASAYEDKILRKKWQINRFCKYNKKYANTNQADATFAKFVDCVLSRPRNTHSDSHVQPLADLCAVCHVKYNLIVKLEELAVNEQFLMKVLNFTSKPDYVAPQQVKSSNVYAKYYKELNEELIDRMKTEYQVDIDLFGYPDSPFK